MYTRTHIYTRIYVYMYVEKKATAAHGEVCASAKQEEMAEEGSA